MAQSVIGNIAVNLLMETAAFEQGASYAEKRLGKMSRKFEELGRSMVDLGQKLSLSVTAPIVAAGTAIIKTAANFEGAMNRLSISTKGSATEMKAMSELALQLGRDTTFGATEAADAMDALAKNGLSARQILDGAARAAVNLAAAAGSDLEPAANAVTDVMKQFGIAVKDLPTVVDQITGAVNESKLSFEDFAMAIGQGGGVAGAGGVKFKDFATALAAVSPLFASGADAGTAFKTFMVALTPATTKAANLMKEFGLRFYDAQGNMRPMIEIAEELKTKLGGLNDEARIATIKEMFGTDAMRVAIGLMNQGAEGLEKVGKAIDATSAADQAAKQMGGLNGQLKQLGGALETLAIRIGQSGLVDFVTRLVKGLTALIEKWSEASPDTLRFATILAVVAAAIGPILAGFGLMVQAFAPLIAAFNAISAAGGITAVFTALAGVLAPLLPIIAAVAAAGALIYANWDKIGPVLADLWKQFQETLGPPMQELIKSVSALFAELSGGPMGEWLRTVVSELGTLAAAFLKAFGPLIIQVLKSFVIVITDIVQQTTAGVKAISALFSGDWKTAVSGAVEVMLRSFAPLPTFVLGKMRDLVEGVRVWIVNKLGGIFDSVKAKIDAVKGWFYGLYDAVVGHSYIPDMVDGIAAQMKRLDSVMVDPAKKATKKAADSFKALVQEVQPLLDRLFPEAAALNKYRDERASIDRAESGKALSAEQAAEMRRRLAVEGRPMTLDDRIADWGQPIGLMTDLQKELQKVAGATAGTAGGVEAANVRIVKSFHDMAQDTLGSLQNLGNSIKSGGFLDIFGSVLDLLLQVGSIGGFGKSFQTKINSSKFGGFRAMGGPVVPGKSYIVGENGPEWFTPGGGGGITPINDNFGGSTVTIVPSPMFEAVVDGRAARVAAPMAAAAGHHATSAAQGGMMRRGLRRIPG